MSQRGAIPSPATANRPEIAWGSPARHDPPNRPVSSGIPKIVVRVSLREKKRENIEILGQYFPLSKELSHSAVQLPLP